MHAHHLSTPEHASAIYISPRFDNKVQERAILLMMGHLLGTCYACPCYDHILPQCRMKNKNQEVRELNNLRGLKQHVEKFLKVILYNIPDSFKASQSLFSIFFIALRILCC